MDPAVWGFIGVMVGGLITGFVTFGVEFLRTIGAFRLDGHKRIEKRRLELDNFQRETLLELQEATTGLVVAVRRVKAAALVDAATMTGIERMTAEAASAKEQRLRLEVATLRSRVSDVRIRDLTDNLLRTTGTIWAKDPLTADQAIDNGAAVAMEILEHAGERIRETFLAEPKRRSRLSGFLRRP